MSPRNSELIPLQVVTELLDKKTFKLENALRKLVVELLQPATKDILKLEGENKTIKERLDRLSSL